MSAPRKGRALPQAMAPNAGASSSDAQTAEVQPAPNVLETQRTINKLRDAVERERQDRVRMETRYRTTSEKLKESERKAADHYAKLTASEKRLSDAEQKHTKAVKEFRSDRRKAAEELEAIQKRCDTICDEARGEARKQIEYSRKELEDTVRRVREDAEARIRETEENAVRLAEERILDRVREAEAESAKADADIQDLRREIERLTEEKSEIVDRMSMAHAKSEKEKYVLFEKLEYIDQQYEEKMHEGQKQLRNELQFTVEKQIQELFRQIEWQKQANKMYRAAVATEIEGHKKLSDEIAFLRAGAHEYAKQAQNSMSGFHKIYQDKQHALEQRVQSLQNDIAAFTKDMAAPTHPSGKTQLRALYEKVQKLKASFAYLRFRSMIGSKSARDDENDGSPRVAAKDAAQVPPPFRGDDGGIPPLREIPAVNTPTLPLPEHSPVDHAHGRAHDRFTRSVTLPPGPVPTPESAALASPYQNSVSFRRRSHSARPSRSSPHAGAGVGAGGGRAPALYLLLTAHY